MLVKGKTVEDLEASGEDRGYVRRLKIIVEGRLQLIQVLYDELKKEVVLFLYPGP